MMLQGQEGGVNEIERERESLMSVHFLSDVEKWATDSKYIILYDWNKNVTVKMKTKRWVMH